MKWRLLLLPLMYDYNYSYMCYCFISFCMGMIIKFIVVFSQRRGHDSTGVTDRVVNQMLTQLDGVEGLHGKSQAVTRYLL